MLRTTRLLDVTLAIVLASLVAGCANVDPAATAPTSYADAHGDGLEATDSSEDAVNPGADVGASTDAGVAIDTSAGSDVGDATADAAPPPDPCLKTLKDDSWAVAVFAGQRHTCAVSVCGESFCWGHNQFGEAGDGTKTPAYSPRLSSNVEPTTMAAGFFHTCGLVAGKAWCWGANTNGQLGAATLSTPSPVAVSGGHTFDHIASTDYSVCASGSSGVYCWGWNNFYQLGQGGSTPKSSNTPLKVLFDKQVIDLTGGSGHFCALTDAGEVWCWGLSNGGQLGQPVEGFKAKAAPVLVAGLSGVVAITAGGHHTCAALKDGTAVCWGLNNYGQLGNGSQKISSKPVVVQGLSDVQSLSAALHLTCAIHGQGKLSCWGRNAEQQLGKKFSNLSTKPLAVDGVTDAVSVATGDRHVCVVRGVGSVSCWGANEVGQVGNGKAKPTKEGFESPQQVGAP